MTPPCALKALVLDWAGTVIDHGSRGPVAAFVTCFERHGIAITEAQARAPMGRAKRDHIAALLAMPAIAAGFERRFGRPSREADIDELYARFMPIQVQVIEAHCELIPGALKAISDCRARGLKVAGTTGYNRVILERVEARAAAQGYRPDVCLGADDVSPGRPAPWMALEALRRLDVWPVSAAVKVDDTPVGVRAGRNAGLWAIGVTASGNGLGLSVSELAALTPELRAQRVAASSALHRQAGAHLCIESLTGLPAALDSIEARRRAGERP